MQCERCNAELPPNAIECPECGAPAPQNIEGFDNTIEIQHILKTIMEKHGSILINDPTQFVSTLNDYLNGYEKERRLLAFLAGYEVNFVQNGLINLLYDYDIMIQYEESCPASLSDVEVDNGAWDVKTILRKGSPKEITLITDDDKKISSKLNDMLDFLLSSYEGIMGWKININSFKNLTTDVACTISYSYMMPVSHLRQLQGKAIFAAKSIWKTILGKSKVPPFVKPFLALSYLTQECCYDQRAFDEVESDPSTVPSDPIPHLAYGPLVEKRGICSGLAWAFKTLMDEANVECICVSGFLKEDLKTGHMWNMVKVDGQFYHVDPTWGIKDSGVFVSGLMQPDCTMKSTHLWKSENYPNAKGMRFDYDYIEEYLAKHGVELLDNGANEHYFFPDEIVE